MTDLQIGQQVPMEQTARKKRKRNYVNNPDFLEALINYKKICIEAEKNNQERPQIPKYIGECIFLISKRIATRKNFSGYPFVDDMIMDAVEICFKYIDRFNSDKYDNPFAFFSRVIWRVFLQRISKEKRHLYIKFKHSQMTHSIGGAYESDLNSDISMSHYSFDVEYMNNFIEEYESKMEEKKQKVKDAKKLKNTSKEL